MLQSDKLNSFQWVAQRRKTREENNYLKMYHESYTHSSVSCFSNKLIWSVYKKEYVEK